MYNAALVVPQIARSCRWRGTMLALCVRTFICLAVNAVLQGYMVFLLNKESLIFSSLAGQMHTCDFAANLANCPDGAGCVGPGGTKYTPDRLYDFSSWSTRNYVRDALHALFPDLADEITSKVDPGEYGIESWGCRALCTFVFVLTVMGEIDRIKTRMRLQWSVPSASQSWVSFERPSWCSKGDAKEVQSWNELDFVKIKVAGIPLPWKIVNLTCITHPHRAAPTQCYLHHGGSTGRPNTAATITIMR